MGAQSDGVVINAGEVSRSRNLLDSIPSLIAYIGPDLRIQFVNRSLAKWLDVTQSSLYSKTLRETFGDIVFSDLKPHIAEVLEGTETSFEIEIPGVDSLRYLEVNLTPDYSEEDHFKGFTLCGHDFTQRKNCEKELRALAEIETQYRQILELLPVAVYTCDQDGRLNLFNKAATVLWGRAPERGKDLWCGAWKIYNSRDGSPLPLEEWPTASILKKGQAVTDDDIVIERPDGSRRNVASSPKPIFDSAGNIIGAINLLIDTTDRKIATEALKQSEERFRMMADLVPIVMWLSDEFGNCTYLNTHWSQLTGKRIKAGFRNGWFDFIHPDEKNIVGTQWKIAVYGRKIFDTNFRYQDAKGEYRFHHALGNPRYNDAGKYLGHIGIMHDVTRQEVIRSILLEELRLRTDELEEKNITLEKVNQDLASFAYISSHDLQEPLRKIQTFSSRILELDPMGFSDTSKDYFARIQNSANRMRVLIEGLLAYSRSNSSGPRQEVTDINHLMQDARNELKELIEEKHGTLEIAQMPALNIIPFQFEQLVINILSNALKYSRNDVSPRITITSDMIPGHAIPNPGARKDRHYHRISFTDNGIGFEPEYCTKIFDVFQRLHNRKDYSGTGVGLAICKKIMDNHHGLITAEGIVNVGATFHIYLPA